MPKLRKYEAPKFTFYIHPKTPIHFTNVIGQETYIKNRVDRLRIKEPETIKWINTFSHDSIFFDIGANIGIYTLYSAVVKQNHVYAFEPHVGNYKNLLDSINLNALSRCQAFNVAISDRLALSKISVKNMHEGVAENKVGQSGDYYHGCTEMDLDSLVEKNILPQPDHVKIDVDGFESQVVQGGIGTLSKCKTVLIEINDVHKNLVDQLSENGLKLQSRHRRNETEFNYIFTNAN